MMFRVWCSVCPNDGWDLFPHDVLDVGQRVRREVVAGKGGCPFSLPTSRRRRPWEAGDVVGRVSLNLKA
jgi:hypothetical protein